MGNNGDIWKRNQIMNELESIGFSPSGAGTMIGGTWDFDVCVETTDNIDEVKSFLYREFSDEIHEIEVFEE